MRLAAVFRNRVRAEWADDPAKRDACYAEFLEADWKSLLKESSEEQIEDELARMLKGPG
jgi:hypothetical protein